MNENLTAPGSRKCPKCGADITDDAAQGLCPACLMAAAAWQTDAGTQPVGHVSLPKLEEVAAAFPDLEIVEVIGQGGMGVVYKARQPRLDRFVALKVLQAAQGSDARFEERFEREARALAKLSHPNIVTIHDFGQAGGFYFLLMEFVDGVNLRQAMRAGRFTPEQALAIVPPVCEALQFAHEHGIVHRDIKPENLLLDKDGRVKIADFGIAKMLQSGSLAEYGSHLAPRDELGAAADSDGARSSEIQRLSESTEHLSGTERATVLGTPRYMAPEQQSDPLRVDHRADIYSLGVVLYELLTGEAPGSKLTPPSQRVQIDVRLDEIVLRALNEKPEMRWQTAADLRTSVQAISGKPEAQEITSAAHSPWFGLILPLLPPAFCALGWWMEMMRIDELRRIEAGAPEWLNLAKFWLDGVFIVGGVALAWRLLLRDYAGKQNLTPFGRGLCLVTAVLGVLLALSWSVEAPLTRESMEAGFSIKPGWPDRWNTVWWRRWLWWAVATPFIAQPMWWIIYTVKAGWEQKRRKPTPPMTTPSRKAPEKTEGSQKAGPFTGAGRTWWHKALTTIGIAVLIVIPLRAWVIQAFVIPVTSLEPELPAGSRVLVWKLANQYVPNDIIAHWHGKQVWVSRVVRVGDERIVTQRNKWPKEELPIKDVIGKVVSVYWRASPAPKSVLLGSFKAADSPISKQAQPEGAGWRVDATEAQVVRLFELPLPNIDECTIIYRAKLKSENVKGRAFLEMWCRVPGFGESFSRGLDKTITGTNDWASIDIPFFLKKGEKADHLKLNLNFEGTGRVWIKDIEVIANGAGVGQINSPDSGSPAEQQAKTPPVAGSLREQLQAQLAERSAKLGPTHPDVMLLRQTLAEIDKRDMDTPAISDAEYTSERLRSAVVKPIEFTVWDHRFAPGDSITIESVEATSPALARGDIVVVKGRFVLQSTDEAALALYLSHSANSGRSKVLPDQKRMISRGSGAFELRCAVIYEGKLHVSFYPAKGGGSFGDAWFGPAAQNGTAKPKSVSSSPVAPQTPVVTQTDKEAPAVSDAENTSERLLSAVVKPIEFAVGEQRFAPGDSITIESVEATSPALGRGDVVVVKGRFVLQSTDEAMLALYLGHKANGGRSKTLPEQTRMIAKGSGVFELRCAINYEGRLHVRFYPKNRSGAFGEIWVGTPAQADASKPESVSSSPAAILRPAITQTASDKAGVIAQIQTAFDAVAKLKNMEKDQRYEVPVGGVPELSPGDDFLRRRTGREVFDSGLSCGCGDHALAFMHLMEPSGLELLMVDGAQISFRALETHWSGHVVVAVKVPKDGPWILADPTQRKIIDENWQRDAKSFYDGRYWIGYAGPISGYPAHTPDELRDFLGKTLATVPPEVFARQMMKFRFKLDASMFDVSGKCVNANAEKMNELQDSLLKKFKITPAREIDVLLVKGGDDASGVITFTEDRGWVATVGLRSGCSSGYIDYMNQQVARKVNVR